MSDIKWDSALCGEASNCFRIGIDDDGNAYIGRTDSDEYVSDTRRALRDMILAIKNGAADHLI